MSLTLLSWGQNDPRTGRWRKLGWKMTEGDAAEQNRVYGIELEKVPESEEVREDLRGGGVMFFDAHCTEAIQTHFGQMQARRGLGRDEGGENE